MFTSAEESTPARLVKAKLLDSLNVARASARELTRKMRGPPQAKLLAAARCRSTMFFSPALHLFRGNVLFMSRDVPDMPKRIHERARPIAIELIFQSLLNGATGRYGALKHCVNVFDVDHKTHR